MTVHYFLTAAAVQNLTPYNECYLRNSVWCCWDTGA